MSSHREAPEISKDPVADNTDVYAFVSPDKPDTVTIISLDDPNWNKRQFYDVSRSQRHRGAQTLGSDLASPPCNIGPRSTPNYAALAAAAVHTLPSGETVFAGQRNDGVFVDLGAIFDLGDLRKFQHLHLIPSADAVGVD